MKIKIELTEDYVGQLKEAGFTKKQIKESAKIFAESCIEDASFFDKDMEELIENMREYFIITAKSKQRWVKMKYLKIKRKDD